LTTRGYQRSFLRKCLRSYTVTKPIVVESPLPFITTFSPSTRKLVGVIKHNFQAFTQASQLLQGHRIIAAFRRNKNLHEHLVSAKLKALHIPKPRGLGQFFQHRTWIYNYNNQSVFKSLYHGDPKSKNCIYIIWCTQCNLQYVGETSNTLLTRFTQHRYNVLRKKNTHTHLVKHFLLHGWQSVRATVAECNLRWNRAQRLRAERVWIHKLNTRHPRGLNEV